MVYHFEHDTIRVTRNETFATKLVVENLSGKEVRLHTDVRKSNMPQGLINLPAALSLSPRATRSFPLKYIADRNTITHAIQAFTVALSGADGSLAVQPKASFFSSLTDENSFSLSTDQSDYFLDPGANSVQIMVQALNTGLISRRFRLQFSEIPEGLEFDGDLMLTTVEPGAQLSIPFTVRAKRADKIVDFDVTIQSLDETGKQLAARRIRVINAGSVRRFGSISPGLTDAHNNALALRYTSLGTGSTTYQLQASGDMDLAESSKLSYRLNMDYYQQAGGISLYDTYVNYEGKTLGLKLGNIYENLDYAISGKGVQGSYKLRNNRRIRVFAVDNDYMLYSQWSNRFRGERILAADYTFGALSAEEGQISYLSSSNEQRKTRINQISGKIPLKLSDIQQLNLDGGYSHAAVFDGEGRHGLALGAGYNYLSDKIQISSNNYYSSPYYTGLRKGLTLSDNRLVRILGQGQSLSARLSYMKSKPEDLRAEPLFNYHVENRVSIAELGYRTRAGYFGLELKPYYMDQMLQNGELWKSRSLRTAANISYFRNDHRLNLSADYGYTFENSANRPVAPFHSLRFNGSYGHRYLGLTSFIQLNPYYLSDIYVNSTAENYSIYSIGPNTRITAFRNKLELELSAMYNVYGFSETENLTFNGNLRWSLKGMWNLTADVFMTRMESDRYFSDAMFNRQLRVGIEKKFHINSREKGKNLKLTYYEDLNNNGKRDRDEGTVGGLLVQIEDQTAITSKDGSVRFENMKEGAYAVQVVSSKRWTAEGPASIIMTKDQNFEVPLVKTVTLRGAIQMSQKQYQETTPSFSGIRINAVDQQGREYNTLSDSEGNYTLYLPPNEYSVYIDTEGMPFSIENQANTLSLQDENSSIYKLDFLYKDNRRKVDIKRF